MQGNLHVRFGGGRREKEPQGHLASRLPYGDEQHLHRLLQAYVVERARIEARKKSYVTTEQSLSDGSILVEIEVGGSA